MGTGWCGKLGRILEKMGGDYRNLWRVNTGDRAHSLGGCVLMLDGVVWRGGWSGDVSEAVQSAPMIALDLMADFFSTRTDDSTFGFIMFFDKFPASEDIPLGEIAHPDP